MDVLAVARRALDSGPICDPCLGRLVANRSHGLTNRQRGTALRTAVALADDGDFVAAGDCWVCEGECDRADIWADRAVAALRNYDFATYQVGSTVPPLLTENDRLLREDAGLKPEAGELLKSELNREVGKRFGEQTGTEVEFGRPDVLIRLDLSSDSVDCQVNSAFIYGRYRKLERGIPQTEWPCSGCDGTGRAGGKICKECDGTGYRYDRSVEGFVAPHIRDAMDGMGATFHGAGREDVDARMLGDGRPFVVEIDEPRDRTPNLDALENRINRGNDGAVEVRDLRLGTYEMVERVKELDARKTYRADVRFDAPVAKSTLQSALSALEGATIKQDTPQRVDHRRASKTRRRRVYAIDGELTGEQTAVLDIEGEGGLYVKELVHGDEGRTRPSLTGELDVDATVEALDVIEVTGEDESFADPDYFRSGDDVDTHPEH